MSINKVLNSLEKSWERDVILSNIKKGLGTDEIVNEFLVKNERQIKELNSLLRPEDIDLLNQVEQLSSCELVIHCEISFATLLVSSHLNIGKPKVHSLIK